MSSPMHRVLCMTHAPESSLWSHLSWPRPGSLIPNTCAYTSSPGLLPVSSLAWVSTKAPGCGTRTTARHTGSVCLESCQCLQRAVYTLSRPSLVSKPVTSRPRLQTLPPSLTRRKRVDSRREWNLPKLQT